MIQNFSLRPNPNWIICFEDKCTRGFTNTKIAHGSSFYPNNCAYNWSGAEGSGVEDLIAVHLDVLLMSNSRHYNNDKNLAIRNL